MGSRDEDVGRVDHAGLRWCVQIAVGRDREWATLVHLLLLAVAEAEARYVDDPVARKEIRGVPAVQRVGAPCAVGVRNARR